MFVELFNTERLSDSFEHLRKTLPRFGHSLVSDRRGSLWMFGGYSLSHGPLNDIRMFDTKNISWIQVRFMYLTLNVYANCFRATRLLWSRRRTPECLKAATFTVPTLYIPNNQFTCLEV